MKLFDAGSGPAIVVVTGLQGRWEWTRPALEALAGHGRVIGMSLLGEPGSGDGGRARSFDAHVDQLDDVFGRARIERATVCGVSYGGWIALRYAARRASRVEALVLASSPGPRFRLDRLQQRYVRAPRLLMPMFVATARRRLGPELRAALPGRRERWAFAREQLRRVVAAPASPARMAARMRAALAEDFVADCTHVTAPTLIVTGEAHLDRVVPVASTRGYLGLIPHATAVVVPGTGHLGLVTRPHEWAALVGAFAQQVHDGSRGATAGS